MRIGFILLRMCGYIGAMTTLWILGDKAAWWQWGLGLLASAWGIWDQWKKSDDPPEIMARGVWAETLLVLGMACLFQNSAMLFLLLSPASRTCIHLPAITLLSLLPAQTAALWLWHLWFPVQPMWLWIQFGALGAVCLYSRVLGVLFQERERLRRLEAVSAFDREQRGKEDERLRLSGRLHDLTGQYWASIVRALDVALAVEDESRVQFIEKAREAALEGLQEMRMIVHSWQDGTQSPQEWIGYLSQAASRLRDLTGIEVKLELEEVRWSGLADPETGAETCARVAIEAMTNAVKHGNPALINVHLHEAGSGLELIVADSGNGKGKTETSAESAAGIGLVSMRRLALQAGGNLEWISLPGQGTTVRLRLPYQTSVFGKESEGA